MESNKVIPVVLCGGSGSRLWPWSRDGYPKQFLNLQGSHTMLQETILRLGEHVDEPIMICGEEHRFLVAEQVRALGSKHNGILLEPEGRNTAPAIALAALHAAEQNEDPMLLVLPADHVILDKAGFQSAIKEAASVAQAGSLVTFGIVPQSPETGYGYIRAGKQKNLAFEVSDFVEKPDQQTAQQYLDSGDYYWNSGMFLFRAKRYLEELQQHRPDIYRACQDAMANTERDLDFVRVERNAFLSSPSDSIDYAVMENAQDISMLPLDCGWSDLGAWSALWEISDKDSQGNSSSGNTIFHNSSNCLVRSGDKLVATVGLNDVIVVDTVDATLVAAKDSAQDVKAVVQKLKESGSELLQNHRKVYRPWGNYDSVDEGERFQVKRIVVNPGAELSLQMHHHRAEHWIVVQGTALVTKGEDEFLVTENQSTYIPLGVKHRLKNPGEIPLELIEVQSGSYLGEDDIVRFEDHYGRAER
ncbi:mannose-1-phosphate guanylyltransferase/mannose-6-phosphate isomerase [bacterium SCSIO 12696]|nr:mannose-1-phosphate guanylyltransferase/mannose-6-phosphate isomerase [bacterium SCSIO 12696]